MFSGLLRNISWITGASLAVKPFWFLFITMACMRVLGVEDYGVMQVALSLAVLAATFVDMGMSNYSIREVAREPEQASLYYTNFIALRLALTLASWGAALGAAYVLNYTNEGILAVAFASAYVLTLNLTQYCRSFYRAFEVLRAEAILLIIEKVLVVGCGAALLVLTHAPHWTLAGMALGMFIATALNMIWVGWKLAPPRVALLDWGFVKRSLLIMLPFALTGLFSHAYFRIDMVMIQAMMDDTAAGQYGAAYRILEALAVLPTIVATSAVYPRLAKLQRAGEATSFRKLLRYSMGGLAGISLFITLALVGTAPWLIHLLDPDPGFQASSAALRVLAWTFPLMCTTALLYTALLTLDDQVFLAKALAATLAANIFFNLWLIPTFGILGASGATVLSELLLVSVYSWRYLRRKPIGLVNAMPSHSPASDG